MPRTLRPRTASAEAKGKSAPVTTRAVKKAAGKATTATTRKKASAATVPPPWDESLAPLTFPTAESERATATRQDGGRVTPFMFRVYDALLQQISKGKFTTYGELASHLGTSPRAVGQALRVNPYAPHIPCHRVIAASGQLGGFFGQAGNGEYTDKKRRMLAEEGIAIPDAGLDIEQHAASLHRF
ncbi:hypothetical protein H9P43_000554 [Blastocladiella emersonii ATCC 22665]|nr:hypothetical protein H9P43_000554 [Blastocladiella emersonii ATCC 22665]